MKKYILYKRRALDGHGSSTYVQKGEKYPEDLRTFMWCSCSGQASELTLNEVVDFFHLNYHSFPNDFDLQEL